MNSEDRVPSRSKRIIDERDAWKDRYIRLDRESAEKLNSVAQERDALRDRLQSIVEDALGPFETLPTDKLLVLSEPNLFDDLRADNECLRAELAELREAAAALVEHIDRRYYHTVAPTQKAIEKHAELGRLAIAVWHKLKPADSEAER